MLNRALPLTLMVLAVAMFAMLPTLALADDNAKGDTHEGKIVRVSDKELIMTDKDGKEHTHTLNRDVKLRLDNKDINFTDVSELKPNMKIRVTTKKGDPKSVVKIEALSKADGTFEP